MSELLCLCRYNLLYFNFLEQASFKPNKKEKKKRAPNVGLEPTTLRLRVSCSTD